MPKTPPITIEPDHRLALVGKTQSGKTHAAGILALGIQRLLVLDGKGLLANPARRRNGKYSWNLTEWESREGAKIRAKMANGEAGRLRVPAPLSGGWEPFLEWAYRQENITVYIDEMYAVTDGNTKPGKWLNALYTRGAELGIGVWAATQRPRNVPVIMFSEAEWKFLFRLTQYDDRRRMVDEFGPVALEMLPPHHFLLYNDAWDTPKPYDNIVSKSRRRSTK